MPFRHPCFISYIRSEHDLVKGFMDQLTRSLKAYLDPYFEEGPYIDKELAPGERFEKTLADAICRSVCMIVVYFPRYATHKFCLREYKAMEIIEEQRLKLLGDDARGRGLIIPIILRGEIDNLPPKIKNHIHFCDFRKFTTATPDISKDLEYVEKIDRIAAYIDELRIDFEKLEIDVCGECSSFEFPGEDEITLWREKTTGPTLRFPLRTEEE